MYEPKLLSVSVLWVLVCAQKKSSYIYRVLVRPHHSCTVGRDDLSFETANGSADNNYTPTCHNSEYSASLSPVYIMTGSDAGVM